MDTPPTNKADIALAFLSELANMRRDRLQEIIRCVVGEDLARVMFNYARQVIESNPNKAVENASSLMILGYLISNYEKGQIPPDNLPV